MKNFVVMKNQEDGKSVKIPVGPNLALIMLPVGLLGIVLQVGYFGRLGGFVTGVCLAFIGMGLFSGMGMEDTVTRKINKLIKKGWAIDGAEGERAAQLVEAMNQTTRE